MWLVPSLFKSFAGLLLRLEKMSISATTRCWIYRKDLLSGCTEGGGSQHPQGGRQLLQSQGHPSFCTDP